VEEAADVDVEFPLDDGTAIPSSSSSDFGLASIRPCRASICWIRLRSGAGKCFSSRL
jgi:hypothetical protein